MTKEYIERGALLELETFLQDADGFECSAVLSVDIRRAKAADVVEVKHGRWSFEKDHGDFTEAKCTVCGGVLLVGRHSELSEYHFCPNCGAKMDGE